jgi:outer membrane protein assembly factor BamB
MRLLLLIQLMFVFQHWVNSQELNPGDVIWKFITEGIHDVYSSPAIGSDGTVYVGGDGFRRPYSCRWCAVIYALNGTTGAKKWEFKVGVGANVWSSPAGANVWSSPAIGADGTVYVGSNDKKIYALDGQTGHKKWDFETGASVLSSPAIGADGTVYIGSDDKNIYALDGETGHKKWELVTDGPVSSSPAIGSDGTVYVGTLKRIGRGGGIVYALNGHTGAIVWAMSEPRGALLNSSPSIGEDGTIYIGSNIYLNSKVYALDGQSGEKKWTCRTGNGVKNSPAIGIDGTLYCSVTNKVYALKPKTGAIKWEFSTGDPMTKSSSPAVGSDGTVYVGSGQKLYALNGETGDKLWNFNAEDVIQTSPVISRNGTLYFGAAHGKVFALATSSTGPADSPWPMFGANAQRTGRVQSQKTHEPIELKELGTTAIPFSFTFTTTDGGTYEVQASHNLKKWGKLQEVKATSAETEFIDLREALFQRQYYRVKLAE